MIMRNNITELLKGVEVEWKTLGEVAKISSGGTPKTNVSEYYGGDIPWLRTQEINFGNIWDTGVKITEKGVNNSSAKWIPKNCVIIAMYGATVGKVGINKIPMTTNQACANINLDRKIANYRYIFHFLSSKYTYIKSLGTGTQTNINAQIIRKLEIPIPPLHVQTEIVRILDTFTALTAELTAELTTRKKQYNYYRDKLLTFKEDEVEWKALGEILHRTKGTKITASKMKEIHKNNAPLKIFAGGKTFALVNFDDIPEKDINREPSIIVKSRGIIEFEYYDKPFSHKNEMWSYHSKDESINIKYVYYFLKTKELHFQNIGSKMQMPQIATPDTDKFIIPIPSLSIQNRIVQILDKFDVLTNSITEGLPREIALRQKQYEYYRNLLLDFPKAEQ